MSNEYSESFHQRTNKTNNRTIFICSNNDEQLIFVPKGEFLKNYYVKMQQKAIFRKNLPFPLFKLNFDGAKPTIF